MNLIRCGLEVTIKISFKSENFNGVGSNAIVLRNPLNFNLRVSSRDEAEYVSEKNIHKYTSKQIRWFLFTLRRLTNRSDKFYLVIIHNAYLRKVEKETEFDTVRAECHRNFLLTLQISL